MFVKGDIVKRKVSENYEQVGTIAYINPMILRLHDFHAYVPILNESTLTRIGMCQSPEKDPPNHVIEKVKQFADGNDLPNGHSDLDD